MTKMWPMYSMEFYPAIKKNEAKFAEKQMDLEDTV